MSKNKHNLYNKNRYKSQPNQQHKKNNQINQKVIQIEYEEPLQYILHNAPPNTPYRNKKNTTEQLSKSSKTTNTVISTHNSTLNNPSNSDILYSKSNKSTKNSTSPYKSYNKDTALYTPFTSHYPRNYIHVEGTLSDKVTDILDTLYKRKNVDIYSNQVIDNLLIEPDNTSSSTNQPTSTKTRKVIAITKEELESNIKYYNNIVKNKSSYKELYIVTDCVLDASLENALFDGVGYIDPNYYHVCYSLEEFEHTIFYTLF